ncbi:MAG TPA: ABC transporter ATP-binding protein [Candidatus Obscuribacterales bacterium]
MSASIQVSSAWLKFRCYNNPSPSLKEFVLGGLKRNKHAHGAEEFFALKNINLSVKAGDRLGIIGLNGAGKSSLLKMIIGIYPPTNGTVAVEGKVTSLIEMGTGFDLELSGRENIHLNGTLLGQSYRQMRRLEKEVIEFSELEEKIDLPVKYYSTGMFGRLAFSIAAVIKPQILIADEIFATGDAYFIEKSFNRMRQMFQDSQIIILVSHSLTQVVELCNKVIVVDRGEIVNAGNPQEMVDFYANSIVPVAGRRGAAEHGAGSLA